MSTYYYLTHLEKGLFIHPDGKDTGYIVSNTIIDAALFTEYVNAYMMGVDLGLNNQGWIVKEMAANTVTHMPRSREGEILESLKK